MKSIILFLFVMISFSANSQTNEDFEYLSMTLIRREIRLSIGYETFERIDVKSEMTKSHLDQRPILKRIQEFEKDGWEFVSSNVFSFSDNEIGNYVLMRKRILEVED